MIKISLFLTDFEHCKSLLPSCSTNLTLEEETAFLEKIHLRCPLIECCEKEEEEEGAVLGLVGAPLAVWGRLHRI